MTTEIERPSSIPGRRRMVVFGIEPDLDSRFALYAGFHDVEDDEEAIRVGTAAALKVRPELDIARLLVREVDAPNAEQSHRVHVDRAPAEARRSFRPRRPTP